MKSELSKLCLCVIILLTCLLENRRVECFQRLLNRRLKSSEISGENFDVIRNIVSASLTANEPSAASNDEMKRDAKIDRSDDKSSIVSEDNDDDNIAAETRDASNYDDENEADDENQHQQVRQADRVEKSIDQSELANDDEVEPKNVKDVTKREVRSENDYVDDNDDDSEANLEDVDSSIGEDLKVKMVARSTPEEKSTEGDPNKSDGPRDTRSFGSSDDSDLDYEKQIENQIQQRIDSIKDDIKRQIEKKQQAREIEANNAKFDELEFPNENDELATGTSSDSSKRSLSSDDVANNDSDKSKLNVRSKRGSELNEVERSEDSKNVALPAKKRRSAKRVTLVERRDPRRKRDRSSILIPEQGHAEVKDDLPADLTLDPNLRMSRSNEKDSKSENSRSARSAPRLKDEYLAGRYRRDMSDELEDKINETPEESGNFLFAPREKSDSRSRRRRSRGHNRVRSLDRGKARKHPRHLRRHRATRESSMEDAEERDKREMDEDAALVEYKESFGGFPSESGGASGRFKRIRRSSNVT